MSGEILQRIAERSQAATAPEPWSFLTPVVGVRRLPFADTEVIDELLEEFTPAQLEAARVLVRRGDNQLEVNRVLVGESVHGLFLRRKKDEAPFDIVNQNGSLATDDPPAFGCGRDFYTKRFSGNTKSVFVAFSDQDLSVLRMLSLPCTPAVGLATMNGEQLRSLFANAPGLPNDAPVQDQTVTIVSGNFRLVLAGWSIAELKDKQPGGVTSIVERLLKAEDAFGFDTSRRIGVWQPATREFNRIRLSSRVSRSRARSQSDLAKRKSLDLFGTAIRGGSRHSHGRRL